MKPYFERLRPCQDNSMIEFINIVYGCGKKFSFAVTGKISNIFIFNFQRLGLAAPLPIILLTGVSTKVTKFLSNVISQPGSVL